MESKSLILTPKLDINQYLEIDNFKKFFDFNFEEEDFNENSISKAITFWEEKNYKKSSSKPYDLLESNMDYAAIIYLYNHPDYKTNSSLSNKKDEIIKKAKLFVEDLVTKQNYEISELFHFPACDLATQKTKSDIQLKVKNLVC
jgi:hypothetical protein